MLEPIAWELFLTCVLGQLRQKHKKVGGEIVSSHGSDSLSSKKCMYSLLYLFCPKSEG